MVNIFMSIMLARHKQGKGCFDMQTTSLPEAIIITFYQQLHLQFGHYQDEMRCLNVFVINVFVICFCQKFDRNCVDL